MLRRQVTLPVPGTGFALDCLVYGHWGRPVLVFPSEAGSAWDYESNGMVAAVSDLVEGGRAKLYCVGSLDAWTWSDRSVPTDERARRHGSYRAFVSEAVLPWIEADCRGRQDVVATGSSMGAYHALDTALCRADVVPSALCLSGSYDPAGLHAWGERGDPTYFANLADHVPNLSGAHLEWLRSRVSVVLVAGEGPFEVHPTGALPSTRWMGGVLQGLGIRCEVDVWGHDSAHDWPWWRRQVAHHLPRLC